MKRFFKDVQFLNNYRFLPDGKSEGISHPTKSPQQNPVYVPLPCSLDTLVYIMIEYSFVLSR